MFLFLQKSITFFVFISISIIIADDTKASDWAYQESYCHKDWVYLVMPHLGYCSASSFADLHCIEGLSKNQLEKLSKSLNLSKGPSHLHDDRTVISLSYMPLEQIFRVSLTSGNLALREGKYDINLLFDGSHKISIVGFSIKENPDRSPLVETPQSQILTVEHKQFLREVVPGLKKYKKLQIQVSGVGVIPDVSLMGFTKAYNDMRQCMGEAVTFNLKDPF